MPLCISLILNYVLDLMLLNPVLPLLAVSRRKSDVLQLVRCCPATFSHLNQNYFLQTKSGRHNYMFIIIICGSVCDRLVSPSDLVKSWGGGGGGV